MSGSELWGAILGEVEKRLRRQQFETWFRCIEEVASTRERLVLSVPNRFYKEWLETYYVGILKDSASAVTGEPPEIVFEISSRATGEGPAEAAQVERRGQGAEVKKSGRTAVVEKSNDSAGTEGGQFSFSPYNSFENFVVGPANRLCHAAALAVVDTPGRAYNPLFLHGGVGLGKTHLLQAVCRSFLAKNPQRKLVYTSCEEFVNSFVSAVQHGDLTSFRGRLRDVDFLVIDDIHFLARAERTQEEFFHTFNTLYNARKQIVLSSDSAPSEIGSLEERMVSRFKWGLVARLDPPTYETRLAIVKKKAGLKGYELPNDVVEFIGQSVDTNIRELEGALTRVLGYAALTNRALDLSVAKEALGGMLVSRPTVSIEDIAKAVGSRFSVKLSDLQGKRRTKSLALPRQICMHIARKMTDYSLEEIGGFFGGRDHTTVMYADDKISRLVQTDAGMRASVKDIQGELGRAR